jgi:hypothetical protein
MNGWIVGWMEEWMDRWMEGWMDAWKDKRILQEGSLFLQQLPEKE